MDKRSSEEAAQPGSSGRAVDAGPGGVEGMVHSGAAADDENLLDSNLNDAEKMFINAGAQRAALNEAAGTSFKVGSDGRELIEDASMVPGSSQGAEQPEEAGEQAGEQPRAQTRAEHLSELKETISTLSERIVTAVRGNYEPYANLASLNFYLEAHHEDVWEMLNTPMRELQRPIDAQREVESLNIAENATGDQRMQDES